MKETLLVPAVVSAWTVGETIALLACAAEIVRFDTTRSGMKRIMKRALEGYTHSVRKADCCQAGPLRMVWPPPQIYADRRTFGYLGVYKVVHRL